MSSQLLQELRRAVDGEVLVPGDGRYDSVRLPWNRTVDPKPAVVVEAAGPEDVRVAVLAARAHGLPFAVQATGHGTVVASDGGLLLSTARMGEVRVDPECRTATATPWAAGPAGCPASTASRPTACCGPRSSPPAGRRSPPAPPSIRTCSGPCAAGVGTSGWRPGCASSCTRWRGSTRACPGTRPTGRPPSWPATATGPAPSRTSSTAPSWCSRCRRSPRCPSRCEERACWPSARSTWGPPRRPSGGSFLNFLSDPARTETAYTAGNYRRLAGLKRVWDPDNFFHLNHNIPPG